MYELNYGITEQDVRAAGKAVNLKYVIMYLCVALIGLAVGITATVINETKVMLVLGIILIVFGGLLLVCGVILAFAPKTALESIVGVGDEALTVSISHESITVEKGEDKTELSYSDITAVKKCKGNVLAYFGKTRALLIKPDDKQKEIYDYIEKRQGRRLPPATE